MAHDSNGEVIDQLPGSETALHPAPDRESRDERSGRLADKLALTAGGDNILHSNGGMSVANC